MLTLYKKKHNSNTLIFLPNVNQKYINSLAVIY